MFGDSGVYVLDAQLCAEQQPFLCSRIQKGCPTITTIRIAIQRTIVIFIDFKDLSGNQIYIRLMGSNS